ncbi:MAG: 5-oxoprolinase subunit PxpA [Planctomycetota bacterium]
MHIAAIDLNVDAAEHAARLDADRELVGLATSVNIACGGHAGNPELMATLVRAARASGAAIGAHPGYPDRENFGRREVRLPRAQVAASVHDQVLALARIAADDAATLRHCKPHGALYHRAMREADLAEAIAEAALRAVARVTGDPFARLLFVGLPGTPGLARWQEMGLEVAREGFADRAYEQDGRLRSRDNEDAVITDASRAAEQATRLAQGGTVDTLCVHGDTPNAAGVLRAVRAGLHEAAIDVRPPGSGG